ncbi:hypothetical protein EG329_011939 [Mollisiaceae sp. DMI_Dod_QoI]|nr:hypothetical protein EG329_011939 [Helotiales sp. DMI_Dod_QoI]
MSSNTTVHLGFWTNYSKGEILGSTLTLSSHNGGFLIAALAIFIQLIGRQSWGIISFFVHQLRTTTQAKDGLHHQQQATLRNIRSDASTIWQFTLIGWAWRSRAKGTFRRSIFLIAMALLHLIAFAAAGILASRFTTAGDEVLVARSSRCGPWASDDDPTSNGVSAAEVLREDYNEASMKASQQNVQDCQDDLQTLPECNSFVRPQLHWSSSTKASCPFDDLCLGPANSSLYMDTGLIDSREDLGVNGQNEDRIQWRKSATCIPITTDGYSKNGTSFRVYGNPHFRGNNSFNYTALFYGAPIASNYSDVGVTDPDLANATYIYTDFADISIPSAYSVIPEYIVHNEVDEDIAVIPPLDVPDSSLTLIFATYLASYSQPSDDLWLSAHTKTVEQFQEASGPEVSINVYTQDQQVSVLACIEQQQICNPNPPPNSTKTCTRFQSLLSDTLEELDEVLSNSRQKMIARTILMGSTFSSINEVVDQTPLLAQALATSGMSLPLPPNQWILEAQNWFSIGLFNMQRLMVDFVTGPTTRYQQFVPANQWSNNTDLRWLCDNQIIRRTNYTNFHTLSFGLIFGLGILVFAVNQSIETIVGWARMKWRTGRWRQRAWWAEGTLQLQRRVFEGMGIKDWEMDEWNRVPITEKGRMFSALRNWDEMLPHPMEHRKQSTFDIEGSPVSEGPEKGNAVVRVEPSFTLGKEWTKDSSGGRPKSV